MLSQEDFQVATLGLNEKPSPLRLSSAHRDGLGDFVPGKPRIRYQLDVSPEAPHQELLLEQAGPRERIYFDPFYTTAAIVTCGGLCPGLNNVIRSIYLELSKNYGVRNVIGIRNGYLGLNPASGLGPDPAHGRLRLRDSQARRHGARQLARPARPGHDRQLPPPSGDQHPVLRRRRRDPAPAPIRSTKRSPAADSRSRWSASPKLSTTTSCTSIARLASPPRSKRRSRP